MKAVYAFLNLPTPLWATALVYIVMIRIGVILDNSKTRKP